MPPTRLEMRIDVLKALLYESRNRLDNKAVELQTDSPQQFARVKTALLHFASTLLEAETTARRLKVQNRIPPKSDKEKYARKDLEAKKTYELEQAWNRFQLVWNEVIGKAVRS